MDLSGLFTLPLRWAVAACDVGGALVLVWHGLLALLLPARVRVGTVLAALTLFAAAGLLLYQATGVFLWVRIDATLAPLAVLIAVMLAISLLRAPAYTPHAMSARAREAAHPWAFAASAALTLTGAILFYQYSLLIAMPMMAKGIVVRFLLAQQPLLTVACAGSLLAAALLTSGVSLATGFAAAATPPVRSVVYWAAFVPCMLAVGTALGYGAVIGLLPPVLLVGLVVVLGGLPALLAWERHRAGVQALALLRGCLPPRPLHPQIAHARLSYPAVVAEPFARLCRDVLRAELAYLVPHGHAAAYGAPPLAFPEPAWLPATFIGLLPPLPAFIPRDTPAVPLACAGCSWAVPIWDDDRVIGLLLLGERRDGGVYPPAELFAAQAVAGTLLDLMLAARIGHSLRTGQAHDEPDEVEHSTLELPTDDAADGLVIITQQLARFQHVDEYALLPELWRGFLPALHAVVDEFGEDIFTQVAWQVPYPIEEFIPRLPSEVCNALFHAAREAIRNAALHASGGNAYRRLHLTISATLEHDLTLLIEDDGVGMVHEGEDTGHGLALAALRLAQVGGDLTLDSRPNHYTRVAVRVPVTDYWVEAGEELG
jgi:hypothetical protein